MLERPKKKRADYDRKHRERVRSGKRTALVEYDDRVITALVRGRYLSADREAYTRAEIGEALSKMVASVGG